MIVDLDKVPSPCKVHLLNGQTSKDGPWCCFLEEIIRGRTITAMGRGNTPQAAVDAAVTEFTK